MVAVVALVVCLVCATALVRALARRIRIPDPIALLLVGAGVAYIPGVPVVRIDPDFVLVVLLPVLLYCAAASASLPAFRVRLRPILLLSVGLTAVTTLAVGTVAALVVPGMGFAAACALGAVVAPPDAVAALAIARTVRMPRRVVTLLEGESLLNDAAALTALTVAVGAVATGSLSLPEAALRFLLTAGGGLVVGGVAAAVLGWVRRRVVHTYTDVVVFLVAPFVAFVPADEIGASGLVAAVVVGFYLGHRATTIMDPVARVVTGSVRTTLSWLLEGVVFLLVGLQLPGVLAGIGDSPPATVAVAAVVVTGTVLVVRYAWIALTEQAFPALARRRRATWAESTLTAWAGMRGAVSLAAVLTLPTMLPDGREFPERDLIVFLTFVVILVTLLGQGATLPRLARRLPGAGAERHEDARDEAEARRTAAEAALDRLERLSREDPGRDEVVEQLRRRAQNRIAGATEQLDGLHGLGAPVCGTPGDIPAEVGAEPARETYRRFGEAMLQAERAHLLVLRNSGRLGEAAFIRIQRELDLEQAALF